ncbi:MAG: CRTAC1 family protein [bacterium]|nr:CRTAC1 family protein [bacterium]
MNRVRTLCVGLSLTALVSTGLVAAPQYVDVTAARNINFVGTYGSGFPLIFPEDMLQANMGNGAAVGDYDGDGDLDIYLLAQLDLPNVLLRNDLDTGSKTFTDVTATAGVGDLGMSRVAHFADLDNDGDLDLVLVNDNNMTALFPVSKLYRNDGGSFTDVTAGSGFEPLGFLRCGTSLADYDGDGLLDVYVTNWGLEASVGQPNFPGSNRLYRNLGGFTFEDVTEDVGLGTLNRDSFTAIFHDFDDDQRPDLWVALDHTEDEFYWNTPTGFVNDTAGVGADHTGNDMGMAAADFDDDGDLDVYATNITDPNGIFPTTQYNVMHVNQDNGGGSTLFVDEATTRGVEDTYWGWGVEFTDSENGGDLDIVAVTGFDAYVDLADPGSPIYTTPSVLFVNDSTAMFVRDATAGLEAEDDSRGLVAFDYDRDGDEDLLITNVNQPVRLLENVSDPQGHWLTVRLQQTAGGNRNGVGATVWATIGGKTRRRDMIVSDSYLTGSPAEVHFGFGAASVVDELRVQWTDGSESTYHNVPVDREIDIVQLGPDGDLDGVEDGVDCAPGDGLLWSAPGPSGTLTLSGGTSTALSWSAPAEPGGSTPRFDLLRGTAPDLSASTCLLTDVPQTSTSDGAMPADIYYYVVRARNACGANAGNDSSGAPRTLGSCP